MDSSNKNYNYRYDRVMSRVHNQSLSSLKSSSFVTRHNIPSSVRVGAKPCVSNVNFVVFSELPTVLNDYVPESDHENVRRRFVKKPRKTIKSLDPPLPQPHTISKHQAFILKSSNVRMQESAPSVLYSNGEKWSNTYQRARFDSRSKSRVKDIKEEIKAFKDKEKMMRLQSSLLKKCGVVIDDVGNVAKDKAVQVQATEVETATEQTEIRSSSPLKIASTDIL